MKFVLISIQYKSDINLHFYEITTFPEGMIIFAYKL